MRAGFYVVEDTLSLLLLNAPAKCLGRTAKQYEYVLLLQPFDLSV